MNCKYCSKNIELNWLSYLKFSGGRLDCSECNKRLKRKSWVDMSFGILGGAIIIFLAKFFTDNLIEFIFVSVIFIMLTGVIDKHLLSKGIISY